MVSEQDCVCENKTGVGSLAWARSLYTLPLLSVRIETVFLWKLAPASSVEKETI